MTNNLSSIEVRPLSGVLGAEVFGIDLAEEIDEDVFAAVKQAYHDNGVIFFREQNLTPQQHIGFAERWGEINVNRFFNRVEGFPMIAEVRKEPEQKEIIGSIWHTDHSYDTAPAMGSILYAHEVPVTGGDTLFASMYRAYETLSEGMQAMLLKLKAVHSSRHVFGQGYRNDLKDRMGNQELATQDAVHPVVISHPDTGRKALYVNPTFTTHFDGWTQEESKPLLDYLYSHAAKPEHTCRFRWRKGSIAFWDNRATWHKAINDYPGQRRLMHRITIEGVPIS